MKKILAILALSVAGAFAQAKNPVVEIKTSAGVIKAELFADKAPVTVRNFLAYVEKKHFDGTVFHRVMKGFMIQGGGFAKKEGGKPTEKPTDPAIKNESDNGLKNDEGTLAMARRTDPHSATAQFFINCKNNNFLNKGDAQAVSPDGYCVFGKVLEGMDIVKKIEAVKTGQRELIVQTGSGQSMAASMRDVPLEDVVIESVKVVKADDAPTAPPAEAAPKAETPAPAPEPDKK